MDRREFLKLAGITGIGISVNNMDALVSAAETAGPPDLVAATGPSPSAVTRAAIKALGGIRKFISKDDVVVVKPNMAWDRVPEQAANTNPEVVAEVVRLCFGAGAKKVRVFDRPVNDPRRCYVQSGIAKAAAEAGADVSYIDDRKFRDKQINGTALDSWPLYAELFEADKIINVPIAKHHGLARLTMAMKNWMGMMGGNRSRIHQKLDESLSDLARVIRPALTVLDAVRILTANGPQGGSLEDVKRIDMVVAGTDQVAVDSLGATLFGMSGKDLGYVKAAAKAGLGEMELGKLNIKKIKI